MKQKPVFIPFVQRTTDRQESMTSGILDQRQDWTLAVDLETQTFPDYDKVLPNLRFDMMVWSTRMRKIIVIELTVQIGKKDAGRPMKEKERNMMMSW